MKKSASKSVRSEGTKKAVPSSILGRIRKLLNLAERPGTVAEGEVAADRLQDLLLRYNLSMSEAQIIRSEADNPIGETGVSPSEIGVKFSSRKVLWQIELSNYVAEAFFCRALASRGNNFIWFVGAELDRELATYVYSVLAQVCETVSYREYQKIKKRAQRSLSNEESYGYRDSWIQGFVYAVRLRLQERKKSIIAQTDNPHALMILKNKFALVDKHMEQYAEAKDAKGRGTAFNTRGMLSGMKKGRVAPIEANALTATSGKQKAIKA